MDKKPASAKDRFGEIVSVLSRYDLIRGITPEKLRHILEDLGPTFIKLGQIMSMRSDLIPDEYCTELTKLRTEVKQMSYEEVLSVIEAEYALPWDSVFKSICETPLGSASIAQVHSAVLKNGSNVVIKVQRLDIYQTMEQDIRLMHRASGIVKIITKTGKAIDFNAVIDEMWAVTKQEMDFLIEAGNIREFTDNNENVKYVSFPAVEWELTTSKLLVMENIEGIQIDDEEKLTELGYDRREIAEKLAANYIKQVLEDGYFHADPHPGNIRIRGGKIVWLDLGMIGKLSNRDRNLFKRALTTITTNDIYELKDVVLAIGLHSGKINHNQLYNDIEGMLSKYASLDLGSINVGRFILDMVSMADSNGITMPAGVSMLGRGILNIEGVLSGLDPDVSFIQIGSAYLSGMVFGDINLVEELKHIPIDLYSFGKKAATIPSNLTDILKMASRGQLKLNLELVGSDDPIAKINAMVNRIIICIISASALIGSSLICMTDMTPKLFGIPFLGVFGYAVSFVMSVWLIFNAMKHRH